MKMTLTSPPLKQLKEKRENPAGFSPRYTTMPVRGTLVIWPNFHNISLELHPLPSSPTVLLDIPMHNILMIIFGCSGKLSGHEKNDETSKKN